MGHWNMRLVPCVVGGLEEALAKDVAWTMRTLALFHITNGKELPLTIPAFAPELSTKPLSTTVLAPQMAYMRLQFCLFQLILNSSHLDLFLYTLVYLTLKIST